MMSTTTSLSPPESLALAPPPLQPPRKRTPVPILLEAFPTPPSHIPPSPLPTPPVSVASNPPPSLPPADPLPPVPGPSPISEHETLMFMASNRSRRSSKVSVTSIHSIRSTLSSPSVSRRNSDCPDDNPVTSPSIATLPPTPRRGSVASARSIRSFSSNGSLSAPNASYPRSPSYGEISPSIGYSISEEDPADLTRIDMDGLISTSPVQLSDIDDVEHENILDAVPGISRRLDADDSISSIDMRDLPALQDEDDEANNHNNGDLDASLDAQALHLRMRAARSRSEMHKKLLRSRSTSPSLSLSPRPSPELVPPVPTRSDTPQKQKPSLKQQHEDARSPSPDIQAILASTPRPRRSSSSYLSHGSSRSTSRSHSRHRARSSGRRHVSEGVPSGSSRVSAGSVLSRRTSEGSTLGVDPPTELAYMKGDGEAWDEDSFVSDYGVPLDSGIDMMDPEAEARLDRELDGSDSDSSIDLHTPLPHLMVRHGLLSPNSKLLPQASRTPSPLPQSPDNRPGSVASTSGSVMTKSGVYKDERDTPKRRVRHRDGKLLRGGIGLTTGLGWSDSEDEDAPSALTRRISSLNLSRRSSGPSMRSAAHPLSRSYSYDTILDDDAAQHFPSKPRSKPRSLPPTSWPKRPGAGRTSTSSAGSSFSLSVSIPENDSISSYPAASSGIRQSASDSSVQPNRASDTGREVSEVVRTPSSSSTLSLPLPITPGGDEAVSPRSPRRLDKEKGLPPLPGSALRKYPSNISLKSAAANSNTGSSLVRPRTYSSASSVSSVGATINHGSSGSPPPMPTTPAMPATPSMSESRLPTTPRPLHLAQTQPINLQPGEQLPKPGKVLTYNRNLHDRQRMRAASGPARPSAMSRSSASTIPSPTSPDGVKPKPRTGTGMVYRTSSNPGAGGPSRMRMPGTPSASLGGGSSSSCPPRSPAIPRPIAL